MGGAVREQVVEQLEKSLSKYQVRCDRPRWLYA